MAVTRSGVASFRYDYRINGRRETLAIGRYDETRSRDAVRELNGLDYGDSLSLSEARLLLTRARGSIELGESPAKAKAEGKSRAIEALSFAGWVEKFFAAADLADSTKAMRRSIYERDVKKAFGRMNLEEITPSMLMNVCESIKKERDAPATAIATFKPRERALSPAKIRIFFYALEGIGTFPQIKLGMKLILLTLLRKGELLNARWTRMDFEAATLTVPAAFMKVRRPHVGYLSQQALDIIVALRNRSAHVGCDPQSCDYIHRRESKAGGV